MKTTLITAASKRTLAATARVAVRVGRRAKRLAERHPGLTIGASTGYALGCLVEKIPGTQILGPLPRWVGCGCGAAMGLTFERALKEAIAEEQAVRPAVG